MTVEEAHQMAAHEATMAQGRERFKQHFGNDEDRRNFTISAWQAYDPDHQVDHMLIGSELGPQVAEKLAEHPELIGKLAELPPQERERLFNRIEGVVMNEAYIAQQQRYHTGSEPRRVTKAPPPINPVRGGAMPPSDVRQMALSENATDYIRARKQQEKRSREG